MEDVEYLKKPCISSIDWSPTKDNFKKIHYAKHYTATYLGAMFRERLVELELK